MARSPRALADVEKRLSEPIEELFKYADNKNSNQEFPSFEKHIN